MNIQSINHEPSFGRLIVRRGSFEALKRCQNFRDVACENHQQSMLKFYKRLLSQKKFAENNNIYNVVLKPSEPGSKSTGRLVIENKAGKEQAGFITPFEELTRINIYEPQKYLTEKDEPNRFMRYLKNYTIKRSNQAMGKKAVNFDEFLDMIYNRIKSVVDNAEYLKDLHMSKSSGN